MADKLYVRGMSAIISDDNEDYFFGKHLTTLRYAWETIFPIETLMKHVRTSADEGKVVFRKIIKEMKYTGVLYPLNSPVSILGFMKSKESYCEYIVPCPLFMGLNNDVKLKGRYSWEEECLGEMAVETDLGKIINFHNPYFAIDNKKFKFDKVQTISLAGLALSINEMEVQEFPAQGDTYKHFLEKFLKENPHKTEKDFETPIHRVDVEHFRMFVPRDYCCHYEIATQIEEIEYVKFLGEKITVMKVNLEHGDDDEYLYCNIYAAQHVLGKYKPKIGDGISAVVWFTGFFN